MDRLTKRLEDGQAVMDCEACRKRGYLCALLTCRNRLKDRLAEYEDTGLKPEEIEKAQKALKSALALACEVQSYRDAKKEGRLIILPCKVGDTVYRVIRAKDGGGHIAPAVVSGIHMADTVRGHRYQKGTEYIVLRVDGYYCDHVDVKKIGKTVFLTREEAEAALKGGDKSDK